MAQPHLVLCRPGRDSSPIVQLAWSTIQLEAAALLSQIGYFAESPELAEKIYYGRALSP